ncbi:MAG: thioether cross-link-forming SCIFF peptide maturase, partial [Oscillospiraceae bacterium]
AREQEKIYNKNFRFTLTTNGLLLNEEIIEYLNKEMSNVVLSIDGRKEINDKVRKRIDGSGCYDKIIKNFKNLVEKRGDKEYYVRGTFTKYNLDFAKDVFHLYEQGFEQISVEPVVSQEDKAYAITEKEVPAICDEYEKLAKMIIKSRKNNKYFNFFHYMIDLDGGPCAIKRLKGCGCGNEYVAATPDGDIYPCHQFVGMDEWKMGNLEDNTFDITKKKQLAKTNIYHKQQCKNCWAKFYCSGGCNANNYQFAGNVLNPHEISCKLLKKRTECALMIKAALSEE